MHSHFIFLFKIKFDQMLSHWRLFIVFNLWICGMDVSVLHAVFIASGVKDVCRLYGDERTFA